MGRVSVVNGPTPSAGQQFRTLDLEGVRLFQIAGLVQIPRLQIGLAGWRDAKRLRVDDVCGLRGLGAGMTDLLLGANLPAFDDATALRSIARTKRLTVPDAIGEWPSVAARWRLDLLQTPLRRALEAAAGQRQVLCPGCGDTEQGRRNPAAAIANWRAWQRS